MIRNGSQSKWISLNIIIINFGSFTFDVPSVVFVTVCSFLFSFADLSFIMFIFISTVCLASLYCFCVYSYSHFFNSFCFLVSFLSVSLLLSRMFSRKFSNCYIFSFIAGAQFCASVSSSFFQTYFPVLQSKMVSLFNIFFNNILLTLYVFRLSLFITSSLS